jgi:hypothetical protein
MGDSLTFFVNISDFNGTFSDGMFIVDSDASYNV